MGVVTSFRLVDGWGDAKDEVSAGAADGIELVVRFCWCKF